MDFRQRENHRRRRQHFSRKLWRRPASGDCPLLIRSDGGDAGAAMAMGRLIRARKLDVIVATTLFAGCPVARTECGPEQDKRGRYRGALAGNKDYCNSACTLILAAGQKRQVELWSTVGVQKLAPEKPSADDKILKASTAKKPGR